MKLLIAIACLAIALAARETLPESLQSSYFPGRSGNVILKPASAAQADDLLAVFIDNTNKNYFSHTASKSPIAAENIADVVTRSLGVSPINDDFTPAFVKSDYFDSAQANFLISAESLGADLLSKYKLRQISDLQSTGVAQQLKFNSYPASALSLSATIASGATPSKHGIIGSKWIGQRGEVVKAFDSHNDLQAANVADVMAHTFSGQSLTVAFSANSQLAASHCAHESAPTTNNFCLKFDDATLSVAPVSFAGKQSAKLAMSAEQIRQAVADPSGMFASLPGAVHVRMSGAQTVTVAFPENDGVQEARFDLSVPADASLFAELAFAYTLPARLGQASVKPLIEDATPDFYALSFGSLTRLIEQYGRESNEFIAGLHLLDAALPNIMTRLHQVYPARAVSELVLLGAHPFTLQTSDSRALLEAVSSLLPAAQSLAEFFPSLYLPAVSSSELSDVCDVLSQKLAQHSVAVYCMPSAGTADFVSLSESRKPRFHTQASAAAGNSTDPTSAEIQRYHIAMWTGIGLAVVVLIAIYSIGCMENRKDSLLYGNFNPNWEDRKKK